MDIFYDLSHFVPMFCPTQGYLLRLLALTHHICATLRMLPPQSHTNVSLYMFLILQFRPPLCIIIPQHQSLIEPHTNKNTTPTMMQLSVQRKSKQQPLTSASFYSTRSTTNAIQKPQTCLLCPRTPLLILVQLHPIPISFACLKRSWPPIVYCQPVSRNTQTTKFLTHNH